MSCTPNPETGESCDCSTGQTQSSIACPVCRKLGMTVGIVTPQNTLKRDVRDRLDPKGSYHFCENPDCEVVYYNEQDISVFTTDETVHKVTIKDASPDTRLCYCFKVLKRQALEEIARTGTTNVFATIQAKMKPGQSCTCEKANPRGDTCSKDILNWLEEQGVAAAGTVPADEVAEQTSTGGCCGGAPVEEIASSGCCGSAPVEESRKGGCC